jgi:putative copper export protein
MAAESLFAWRDVALRYAGFLSSYAMLGAIGFRYGVLRERVAKTSSLGNATVPAALERGASAAAGVGLLGAGLGAALLFVRTLAGEASSSVAMQVVQGLLLVPLVAGFFLAWRKVPVGWQVAASAGLLYALRDLTEGKLAWMVNPLHVLGGSLWLGTLFVLVVCGIGQMLSSSAPQAARERAVADMVHRFSPVALGGAGLLGVTGAIAALIHLDPLRTLWTTAYGYALMAKLCLVSVVLALGALNWRRVGPSLGTDGGAARIRRTASTELVFAGLVLFVTSILVSLPSPTPPADGAAETHPGAAAVPLQAR